MNVIQDDHHQMVHQKVYFAPAWFLEFLKISKAPSIKYDCPGYGSSHTSSKNILPKTVRKATMQVFTK